MDPVELQKYRRQRGWRWAAVACAGAAILLLLQAYFPVWKLTWSFFWILFAFALALMPTPFERVRTWPKFFLWLGCAIVVSTILTVGIMFAPSVGIDSRLINFMFAVALSVVCLLVSFC
jgi:hypothetical protein